MPCLIPFGIIRHVTTAMVLYTKVDAQCRELATVVGRTKLTTLATVDVPWRNSSKFSVWDKVPEENKIIFGNTRIPLERSVG